MSVDALEQLAYVNLQGTGELHYVFHPHVAFAALDPTDIRGVKPALFREPFLRPFPFQP